MPFFRDEKLLLHYMERGAGEPLVLIHGLASSGADWAFQVAALENQFRVIVPDLPGSGHSPPPEKEYTIAGMAHAMWALLDHLGVKSANVIGFSLGGAVALEMATQRPEAIPRLGLINSLATYRPTHWHKWFETYLSAGVVMLLGMRRAAWLIAARLFPEPWQRKMRDHTALHMAGVPASSYLGMGLALTRWAAVDRLDRLSSRILMIAAEHDYTPLEEKKALAALLKADIVVVRGSRHGTPFDSVVVTNASLLALLTDQPLPPSAHWQRDTPSHTQSLTLAGSIAEDHALVAKLTAVPATTYGVETAASSLR